MDIFGFINYNCCIFIETANRPFMKNYIFLILFCLPFTQIFSQDEKLIDSNEIVKRTDHVYSLINQGETAEAVSLLQSIIDDSESIGYKDGVVRGAKGLMTIYNMQGNYKMVISTAESVEDKIKDAKTYGELASMAQYKGMAYLNLGFLDLAKTEFEKASEAAGQMDESDGKHYVMALIFDNLAGLHDQMKNSTDSVIYYTNKAIEETERMDENGKLADAKHSQLAFQYMNLGEIYLGIDEPEKAETYFLKSLSFYEDGKEFSRRDKIILYSELGGFYTRQKRYKDALEYLQSAVEMEKNTSLPEIRKEIFQYLSEYYLETGDTEQSKKYLNLSKELEDSINHANRSAVNENLNRIVEKTDIQNQKEKKRMSILYLGILAVLLILIILAWFFRERHLRDRYRQIIDELQKNELTVSREDSETPETSDTDTNDEVTVETVEEKILENSESDSDAETDDEESDELAAEVMTDKTYQQILKNLEKFEKSNRFLKSDVTFPFLVNYAGTNSRYLSQILKTEKSKSFNQYINDLRIDYLIKLLYTQPKYREYKIEYLSKEVGFQSRSAFINSFKKKTGITPSYFIRKLREELS